jgi:hypothetical protein
LGVYWACLGYLLYLPWASLGSLLDFSWASLGLLLGLSCTSLGAVLDLSWSSLGAFLGLYSFSCSFPSSSSEGKAWVALPSEVSFLCLKQVVECMDLLKEILSLSLNHRCFSFMQLVASILVHLKLVLGCQTPSHALILRVVFSLFFLLPFRSVYPGNQIHAATK